MLIKSIKLKNFQCYFGDEHEINFTTGLNIITGSIASGKSKLFDATWRLHQHGWNRNLSWHLRPILRTSLWN